jgi:hypothetical protein
VALGDSYSAAPLVPVTDIAAGCFRSSNNYPALLARALGARLDDRSCGGADTADFYASQRPGVPPQLTALRPDTELVTVGMGGNDQRVFGRLIYECPDVRSRDPQGAPCRELQNRGGTDALREALHNTATRLTSLLRQVHTRSPRAKVLVVGYPQIVSAEHVCAKLPLARGDYAYAEQMNRALNDAVATAARATGSTYVDVWTPSRGHDICAEDPWINGAADDRARAVRYHPFAEEQAAVAKILEASLRG